MSFIRILFIIQRLPDGTLLNYLPIVVGDPVDDNQITYSVSELYKTGFFADVKFFRDGDILVDTGAARQRAGFQTSQLVYA